jgi:hypothetical protein
MADRSNSVCEQIDRRLFGEPMKLALRRVLNGESYRQAAEAEGIDHADLWKAACSIPELCEEHLRAWRASWGRRLPDDVAAPPGEGRTTKGRAATLNQRQPGGRNGAGDASVSSLGTPRNAASRIVAVKGRLPPPLRRIRVLCIVAEPSPANDAAVPDSSAPDVEVAELRALRFCSHFAPSDGTSCGSSRPYSAQCSRMCK